MNSKLVLIVLVELLYQSRCSLAVDKWNYTNQQAWKAVSDWSCDEMRQSPININQNSTVENSALIDLSLDNFGSTAAGIWKDNGHSLIFTPNASASSAATFENHRGTYTLLQFHFHWGASGRTGSEHTVDGVQYDGELHFVTKNNSSGPDTAGDALAVIGVLLTAADIPLTGTWQQLMPTPENVNSEAARTLNRVVYSELLPTNLSYYHYEGSLTTPACSETVQWFVLRNPVKIPSTLLASMYSKTRDSEGDILTLTFRNTQPLNGREVMVQGSGSAAGLCAFNTVTMLLVALMVAKFTQV